MAERKIPAETLVVRNPLKHAVAEWLTEHYVDASVEGSENFQPVPELVANNKHIVIASNHDSHSNAPIIENKLRRLGYGDLADRLVFILGIRLINNRITRQFINSYNFIPVWPPTEVPGSAEERKEAKAMLFGAVRAAKYVLRNQGLLGLFPQGGRSYDQQINRVDPRTTLVLHILPDTYVSPWSIQGSEDVLPVGAWWPRKGKVHVNIGELISIDKLKEDFIGLSRDDMHQAIADILMRKIAEGLPESSRGYYG